MNFLDYPAEFSETDGINYNIQGQLLKVTGLAAVKNAFDMAARPLPNTETMKINATEPLIKNIDSKIETALVSGSPAMVLPQHPSIISIDAKTPTSIQNKVDVMGTSSGMTTFASVLSDASTPHSSNIAF